MKRKISMLVVICFIISLVSCGNNADSPNHANTGESAGNQQQIENWNAENELSDNEPKRSGEKLGTFNTDVSLIETVIFDENSVKITATGLQYTNYSVELELTIENNSDKNLSFISGSVGYSCNSINGYMVKEGYLNCDVAVGKKLNESIRFNYDGLMFYGINEIADIEIGFDISDEDYNHIYSGPRQIKTSAFNTHDYDKNCYQETIMNRAAMNTYDYRITHFSQDELYDDNGVKLLSSAMITNRDGEVILLLELMNTTNSMVYTSTSDIAINGLVASSAIWSSYAINPGKRGIADVDLSSVLNSEYWDLYGIKEVGAVSLALSQRNSDGNDISNEISIEVVVPGAKAEYDTTGKEVYDNDGLRIVAKSILEDSSEYSSDVYVLLLAENNSGKTLSIDDVYDSLSVNGFMTDYSCYSKDIADGECAVLEIKLFESSLEGNKIASVSDIKEVEIGFEIKEGSTTIGEPMIVISFD